MHLINTYESTNTYEPANPDQRGRVAWTWPRYSTFLWNRTQNPGQLAGRGLGFWSTLPSWGQLLLVGAVSAGASYFAMKKFGASHIKPALRKVGINLAGARRRR